MIFFNINFNFVRCILICIWWSVFSTGILAQEISIQNSDQHSYQIEFKLERYYFRKIQIPNSPSDSMGIVPSFPGSIFFAENNQPILSQTGFSLVLPRDSKPTIQIISTEAETVTDIDIPFYYDTLLVDEKSGEIAAVDLPFVRYGGVQFFKQIPLFSFQIKPFQYDPNTKTLRVFKHIIFTVETHTELPAKFQFKLTKSSQKIMQSMVLNSDQVVFNPIVHSGSLQKQKVQNENWYDPTRSYVKIMIAEDGIYHIDPSDLLSLGVPVDQVDPRTFELYYKGKPYPILVSGENDGNLDPADYIEFYGRRNPGIDQFYNDYSDTSVYWLTWNGSSGMRTTIRSAPPTGGEVIQTFYHHQHLEEDHEYYNGDNSLAVFNTDRSPGEGWIWQRIYAGEELTTPLKVYDYSRNKPDSIFVLVHGITDDAVNPDHHIEIQVNGQTISDFYFDGNETKRLKSEIPANILKNGNNTIKIRSLGDTGAEYDAFYVDWFETAYSREFKAVDDQLTFLVPNDYSGSLVDLTINRFSQDSIVVYNISNLQKVEDYEIHASNNQYSVSFSDSISDQAEYFVCSVNAIKKPPRVIMDRSSDLKNPTHQADYLIITHRLFWQQANELAQYRQQTDGLVPYVVDIEDILDEFNYGFMDPQAIHLFIQYTVENWQKPAPQYVLLFGDATWDYKKSSLYAVKNNFVPSYGNPVSDTRLVSIDSENDYLPDLYVGRLPVESVAQAQAVLDKIKAYDSADYSSWNKNIIFLNGGFDEWEQNLFKNQSEELIQNYVEPPLFSGNPIRIYLEERKIAGMNTRITNALNDGALWLSFVGHAGSRTWDLMYNFPDINDLDNLEKLPFVTSMTCHTARFANPITDSFGEAFIAAESRGAIAFLGTTGWGYIFQDEVLLNQLFQVVMKEDVTSFGEAVTLSKLNLWNSLGYSELNIRTIEQYTLLGDPVQRIKKPDKPDPAIFDQSISVDPEEPTENDSALYVNFKMLNYGLSLGDSLNIEVSLRSVLDNQVKTKKREKLPFENYALDSTLSLPSGNLVGEVRLEIRLDPENQIDEINETNNYAENDFYVYSTSISISKPPPYAVIDDNNPTFQVYTPEVMSNSVLFDFQIDTTESFNSPFMKQVQGIKAQPIVASWTPNYILNPGNYFWRCRTNDDGQYSRWITSSFYFSNEILSGWRLDLIASKFEEQSKYFKYVDNKVVLEKNPDKFIYLEVESGGYLDGKQCFLMINNVGINQSSRGHNIVVVDEISGNIITGPKSFDTWGNPSSADSLADFINDQPDSAIIMVGISDEGTRQMNEAAYQALESIGSIYCRSVESRESWAIIGKKGSAPGSVPEDWKKKGEGYAVVKDTLKNFYFPSGTLTSPEIGPAAAWHQVDWQVELAPATRYSLGIRAFNKTTKEWQLYQQITDERRSLSLEDLNADVFSKIKLELTLFSDDSLHTPGFSGWQVVYDFPPDLATHPSLFTLQQDSVLEGDSATVMIPVHNVGMAQADSIPIRIDLQNDEAGWDSVNTALIPLIKKDDSTQVNLNLPTAGYPGSRKYRVFIDPQNRINELSETNNQYTGKLFVRSDSTQPTIRISFDEREILPGDLVIPEPVIRIEIQDNSKLVLTDTSCAALFLDSQPVYYSKNADKLEFESTQNEESNSAGAVITYRPVLEGGIHFLEVIAKDATQNPAYKQIEFTVETTFNLRKVLNIPNPFKHETHFTYILTQPAERVTLSIFTVSGRQILKLDNLPGQIGFNSFLWDGRDADGDEIANGVYLYRIQAFSSDETVSVIEKLVVMK